MRFLFIILCHTYLYQQDICKKNDVMHSRDLRGSKSFRVIGRREEVERGKSRGGRVSTQTPWDFILRHGRMDRYQGGWPRIPRGKPGVRTVARRTCARDPMSIETSIRPRAISTRVLVFLVGSLALLKKKERPTFVSLIEHEKSYK